MVGHAINACSLSDLTFPAVLSTDRSVVRLCSIPALRVISFKLSKVSRKDSALEVLAGSR